MAALAAQSCPRVTKNGMRLYDQTQLEHCWIGRFGWLGDRVSLEDQVANAAFVEMNMTTRQGYKPLYRTKGCGVVPDPL